MATQEKNSKVVITRWWLKLIITVFFLWGLLFASSGKIDWWMAWAYLFIVLIIKIINAMTIDSSLMDERSQPREGTKKWDIPLVGFVAVIGPVLTLIVAGLDVRFEWSHEMPFPLQIIGTVLVIFGGLIVNWAMATNRYFSSTVRIQTDRDHIVTTSGPYKYLRHPGYVGAIIGIVMTPFLLGSWPAFIPAFLVMLGYIIRTDLEDKTLQAELTGYKAYTKIVRYRLFPGIW